MPIRRDPHCEKYVVHAVTYGTRAGLLGGSIIGATVLHFLVGHAAAAVVALLFILWGLGRCSTLALIHRGAPRVTWISQRKGHLKSALNSVA